MNTENSKNLNSDNHVTSLDQYSAQDNIINPDKNLLSESVADLQLTIKQSQVDKSMIEFSGEYTWLKLVSQDTFGTVYKVKEIKTGNIFTLKRVRLDPTYKTNENGILKELKHPNCVSYHYDYIYEEHKTDKKFLNIIMEYIPMTLHKVIRYYRKKALEFPQLLGKLYAYQLFRALLYFRNKSIIHRDLKPINILIKPNDQKLIIADFGNAKKTESDMRSVYTSAADIIELLNSFSVKRNMSMRSICGLLVV